MSAADLHTLSNHFQAVRLVSLHSWAAAAEFPDRDAHGPYMVAQKAYAPDDLTLTPDEFILGRSGAWLSVARFFRLPVESRRAEFLFATAAEVMMVLGTLPPKPVLAEASHAGSDANPDTTSGTSSLDPFREVFDAAPRSAPPQAS